MCIKGTDSFVICGVLGLVGLTGIGTLLSGVGLGIGLGGGWHAAAIGFMIPGGGLIFSGAIGGASLLYRGLKIDEKQDQATRRVSQAYQQSIGDKRL